MSQFEMFDTRALSAALSSTPLVTPNSDKGRFFNYTWWPAHYAQVEGPVLEAIGRIDDDGFDRRVSVLRIAEAVDAKNEDQLRLMGFSASEITRYVTRAINKRLRTLADSTGAYFVIRNSKLNKLLLENKAA